MLKADNITDSRSAFLILLRVLLISAYLYKIFLYKYVIFERIDDIWYNYFSLGINKQGNDGVSYWRFINYEFRQ